ncbi:SH3 domain-containing protein [Clostridium peptidivorans]|uniref:SH3 domain-containing protein n=1 Tax=Clostridium peptidivorans TaxID=100174 RepID=UPI000BE37704|nr:SH3 domain-containing protein [Clostridium peptidivorans]
MNKKLLSSLIALTIVGGNFVTSNIPTKAATLENKEEPVLQQVIQRRAHSMVRVIATSGANIRSGAGNNYSIVATANYGQYLDFLQEVRSDSYGTNWYKVQKSNGVVGWISGDVCEVL